MPAVVDDRDVHRQPHRRPHLLWLDTRTLTNGLHTITAVALSATDVPLGSDSVHVTVANPLPRVQIRTPRTNATVRGTLEIEASVTSPDNVARLSFEVRTSTSERRTGGGTDLPDLAIYEKAGDYAVVVGEVKTPREDLAARPHRLGCVLGEANLPAAA